MTRMLGATKGRYCNTVYVGPRGTLVYVGGLLIPNRRVRAANRAREADRLHRALRIRPEDV